MTHDLSRSDSRRPERPGTLRTYLRRVGVAGVSACNSGSKKIAALPPNCTEQQGDWCVVFIFSVHLDEFRASRSVYPRTALSAQPRRFDTRRWVLLASPVHACPWSSSTGHSLVLSKSNIFTIFHLYFWNGNLPRIKLWHLVYAACLALYQHPRRAPALLGLYILWKSSLHCPSCFSASPSLDVIVTVTVRPRGIFNLKSIDLPTFGVLISLVWLHLHSWTV